MKKILFSIVIIPYFMQGQLKVAHIFADRMVIQQNAKVPVWGVSQAGDEINVNFLKTSYRTTVAQNGKWKVFLPATQAGGPYKMTIDNGKETVKIKDIMVGDVWLCSGQSNMEWTVKNSEGASKEITNNKIDGIRHFKIPRSSSYTPEDDLHGGSWVKAVDAAIADFSAVGYYFAKEIDNDLGIPIGLINSTWGGSRIEPWMSARALGFERHKPLIDAIKRRKEERKNQVLRLLEKKLQKIPFEELGLDEQGNFLWKQPGFDDSRWEKMMLPGLWEQKGWENLDGIVWFRKSFVIEDHNDVKEGLLSLGAIDDSDQVWVNGTKVGGLHHSWNVQRKYNVPAGLLKKGVNVISVRVEDTGQGGGIYGKEAELFLQVGHKNIPLAGFWTYKIAKVDMDNASEGDNQLPTLLYNAMIHPILDFPIKGVLWYQGESNAGPNDAYAYRDVFTSMINQWRQSWGIGDFPFLFVQLANFMQPSEKPSNSNWAMLRESQSAALQLPNTGQAVSIDLGETDDIHPKNKKDVGKRLALLAQHMAYKKNVVFSGPTLKKVSVSDGNVILEFDHIGGGLIAKGDPEGKLKEFTIAGENKKFRNAHATLQGNTVIVWHKDIKHPVSVRYGWSDNPIHANFYNKEGLPASPFRTDTWEE